MARLRRSWSNIVGPMMATRTEPANIEKLADSGICLWIAVDHPIMAQQIRFLRDDIRKACFRHAGITNLFHIRTKIQAGAGIRAALPRKAVAKKITLSRKKAVALELAGIRNRTLRKAAFKARVAQLAYEMIPPKE